MTSHTLQQCRRFAEYSNCEIRVWFTGSSVDAMESLYGRDLQYDEQPTGDLGSRMRTAFEASFAAGAEQVVALGTDCATLSHELIQAGYQRLASHDSVFAPATDGGYVLIGLSATALSNPKSAGKEALAPFFSQIDWGTERVLEQTTQSTLEAGFSLAFLPVQSDVDRPEDVAVWQATCRGELRTRPKLSVIIPVLNAEERLGACLQSVLAEIRGKVSEDVETIVVAAGDVKNSAQLAAHYKCQFVQSEPGRATQMNLGATYGRGDVLLFLHADTQLPSGYWAEVQAALSTDGHVGGAFQLGIDSRSVATRCVERMVGLRSRLFGLPYGDQAIFVQRSVFEQLGGFPDMPIMEDYEFVRRMRKHGRIALCNSHVLTSGRRWQRLGVAKTTLINQLMICGYHLGIPPRRLAKLYRRKPR